jgi:uncharacterized C2H2 Zn-finger protein
MKTTEEKLAYIAAFIDGEGHIGNHLCNSGHNSRSIGFCNTDKSLIDAMILFLNDCGFPTRVTFDTPKNGKWSARWTVYIAGGRKSFERFRDIVPIQSERKKKELDSFFEKYEEVSIRKSQRLEKTATFCRQCQKKFYAPSSIKKRGGGLFCSVKCRGESGQKRSKYICDECGNVFERLTSYGQKSSKHFCSLSCAGKQKSERMKSMAKMANQKRWSKQ